ncbi:pyridoxal phosphate-dependent transferase [Xylariaceae sp. FL0804]|nr:pyridoxal phosphate-dependent transferase [Xylariaceae sp. FL0804]
MDSQQFREAAVSAVDEIVNYYDNIEERPVMSTVEPGYLRKLLPDEAPEEGEPWADIQKDVETKVMPGITHWQSPNFLAWFPSSSSYAAMLGEMYAQALTGAAFNWVCSPAVTELETVVLDWLARAFALPAQFLSSGPTRGGGVVHGTASEAVATVLVAARDRHLRAATAHLAAADPEAREDAVAARRAGLVALAGQAAHSATRKAAQIAGVRFRTVPADRDGRTTGAALAATLAALRARGLEPFFLTATLGTTDSCAVDDLGGIADAVEADRRAAASVAAGSSSPAPAASPPGVWVHVDAAYAGAALVCPEQRALVPGLAAALARFESYNTNLHKWLLVNFDCSALWVRDRRLLTDALRVGGGPEPAPEDSGPVPGPGSSSEAKTNGNAGMAILRNAASDAGLVTDYRDWQIPFGRRFRALKIWFVLRAHGLAGLRAHVRRGVGLAERFADRLRARPDLFELVAGPRFALTLFRVIVPANANANANANASQGGGGDGLEKEEAQGEQEEQGRRNALTQRVYDAVLADGRIFLSSTVLSSGVYAIRHNPAGRAVEEHHVDRHFDVIVEVAERVRAAEP